MEESQKFFEPTPVDRDATLVHAPAEPLETPRFDEVEAQVARPVVPLADSPVRKRRRQWPIALVLISALAGGVVSLFAFRLYQQRQQGAQQVVATETEGRQLETPVIEPTPVPQETATEEVEQAQTQTPVVFEELDPAKERAEVSDARSSRKAAETDAKPERSSSKDERKDEAKPVAPAPRPRIVETITSPRREEAEQREDSDDRMSEDERLERRRERRRQRREGRREPRRNIDRIKDIFEGPPPA